MRVMCTKLGSRDIKVVNEALGDLRVKLEMNRPLVEDNIVKVWILSRAVYLLCPQGYKGYIF